MTTDPMQDIQDALQLLKTVHPVLKIVHPVFKEEADKALAALDSIRDRYLPELPDGYVCQMQYDDEETVCAVGKIGTRITKEHRAKTPNAAFLAAIKAIGGGV